MQKLVTKLPPHQFIDRETGKVVTEKLMSDPLVTFLYSHVRERTPFLFNLMTSAVWSKWVGYLNYETALGARLGGNLKFLRECGIDWRECMDLPEDLDTPRKVFERKIRYWDVRLMPDDRKVVVSPADSRVLIGSFREDHLIPVKEKIFVFEELIGIDKKEWLETFRDGEFAVFRLTPEKYHYNHCPVSGKVVDIYEIEGRYHSCNPATIVQMAAPYSKNKRTVTIIDTDIPNGTRVGKVAMVEIVALMIGQVVQCYSDYRYHDPIHVGPGMWVKKGQPKSLFRPGSSTTILIFEKNRVEFDRQILANQRHPSAQSRYSFGLETTLVETDVRVRSEIGRAKRKGW